MRAETELVLVRSQLQDAARKHANEVAELQAQFAQAQEAHEVCCSIVSFLFFFSFVSSSSSSSSSSCSFPPCAC